MPSRLFEILVPKTNFKTQQSIVRDDFTYPLSYHKEWDRKVMDIAGGLTVMCYRLMDQ